MGGWVGGIGWRDTDWGLGLARGRVRAHVCVVGRWGAAAPRFEGGIDMVCIPSWVLKGFAAFVDFGSTVQ